MNHGHDTPSTAGANAAQRELRRAADAALSAAYLRLREIIGWEAFDTPYAPSPEQVWDATEKALRRRIEAPSIEFCAEIVDLARHDYAKNLSDFEPSRGRAAARVRAKLTAYQEGGDATSTTFFTGQKPANTESAYSPAAERSNLGGPARLSDAELDAIEARAKTVGVAYTPWQRGRFEVLDVNDVSFADIRGKTIEHALSLVNHIAGLDPHTIIALVDMARDPAAIADAELDELDALADAATNEDWQYAAVSEGDGIPEARVVWGDNEVCRFGENENDEDNARYIARIDPPTLKRLIARLRAAEESLQERTEAAELYHADWLFQADRADTTEAALRARGPASEDDVRRVARPIEEEISRLRGWLYNVAHLNHSRDQLRKMASDALDVPSPNMRAVIAALPDRYAQGRADEREACARIADARAMQDRKHAQDLVRTNPDACSLAKQRQGAGECIAAAIRAQPAVETAKQSNPFPRVECAGLRGAVEEGRKQLAHAAPHPASEDDVEREARAQVLWAIKKWHSKLTPQELCDAIFDAPAMHKLAAAIAALPDRYAQGRADKREAYARIADAEAEAADEDRYEAGRQQVTDDDPTKTSEIIAMRAREARRIAAAIRAQPAVETAASGPYDALIEERGTLLASVLEHAKTDLITAQINWGRIVEIDAELSKAQWRYLPVAPRQTSGGQEG